jgi:thiamine-phosphate pyrophosphorylase
MFALKNKYFLIIESIKDIDLSNIKNLNKFIIIYRNKKKKENINNLLKFRRFCRVKRIEFYVSNDAKLASILKADGLYISAHNKNLNLVKINFHHFKIIGSAHNIRELNIKNLQGCSKIIFSRLFKTSYKYKKGSLGIVKFNLFKLLRKEILIPLGGINLSNLNKLKLVQSEGFAMMSEVKKNPDKIFSRLF